MSNKAEGEEEEIWKVYPDYPFLQANQFGEIRTVDYYITCKDGRRRLVKGHKLKQYSNRKGYKSVRLSENGKTINLQSHRIILACFRPNPNNLPEVNHIDCNPANNKLDNLEYCNREYNIAYREKYGKSAAKVFGRPVVAIDLETYKVFRFRTQKEAGQKLGVSSSAICMVVNGQLNQTGGYYFTENESEITEKKIQEIKANMWSRQVIAINPETFEVFLFKSQRDAGRKLGISYQNINKVIKGQRDKAGGYWFCYADESAVEKTRNKFGDDVAHKVEELMKNK